MNILQVNKYLYPRDGVTAVFEATVRALKARGHTLSAFGQKPPSSGRDQPPEAFPCGIPKETISEMHFDQNAHTTQQKIASLLRMFTGKGAVSPLKRLLSKQHFDLAHLHNIYHHISPVIIPVLKRAGIPVVVTLHDYKLFCLNYLLLRKTPQHNRPECCTLCLEHSFLEGVRFRCVKGSKAASLLCFLEACIHRRLWSRADCFIVPSRFMGRIAEQGSIPRRKIRLLRNPAIMPDSFTPAASPQTGSSTPLVLFLGRLSPEKGADLLINAFSHLKGDQAELVIAGEGPEKAKLKEQARLLNAPVSFPGFLEGSVKYELLQRATVLCVPSLWYENCPMCILEAFSLGKAVIASSIGGIAEMIDHGKSGLLVTPGDEHAFAAALTTLLHDRRLRRSIEERAARTVRTRFSAENYADQLEELYRKLP